MLKCCFLPNTIQSKEYNLLVLAGVLPIYIFSNLDPLSSLKWLVDGYFRTPFTTPSKREFEDENTGQSRKRRLSIAMGEVVATFSRLKEITANNVTALPETCQKTLHQDVQEQVEHDDEWSQISDKRSSEVSEDLKSSQEDKYPDLKRVKLDGVACFLPLAFGDLGSLNRSSESEERDESSYEGHSNDLSKEISNDEDLGEWEYSMTPEPSNTEESVVDILEKLEYDSMDEDNSIYEKEKICVELGNCKYRKSSEIPESGECIELPKKQSSYHSTPENEIEAVTTDSSLPSLEDDNNTPSSPYYRPRSSINDFSPVSPTFQVSSSITRDLPFPSLCYKQSISTFPVLPSPFLTDDPRPSFRTPTPIKQESPPYSNFIQSDLNRQRFPVEMFPENITPRSPARQARLEQQQEFQHSHQKRVKSLLLDQYRLASSVDDIYLPNLKKTLPEGPPDYKYTDLNVDGDVGTQVWDAKVVAMGDRTARFRRIGKATCS